METKEATPARKIVTTEQLAEMLQVSTNTVRRYVHAHTIPCIGCGRLMRFDVEAVIKALNRK